MLQGEYESSPLLSYLRERQRDQACSLPGGISSGSNNNSSLNNESSSSSSSSNGGDCNMNHKEGQETEDRRDLSDEMHVVDVNSSVFSSKDVAPPYVTVCMDTNDTIEESAPMTTEASSAPPASMVATTAMMDDGTGNMPSGIMMPQISSTVDPTSTTTTAINTNAASPPATRHSTKAREAIAKKKDELMSGGLFEWSRDAGFDPSKACLNLPHVDVHDDGLARIRHLQPQGRVVNPQDQAAGQCA